MTRHDEPEDNSLIDDNSVVGEIWHNATVVVGEYWKSQMQLVVNNISDTIERLETEICNYGNKVVCEAGIKAYKDAPQEIEEHCGVSPEKEED